MVQKTAPPRPPSPEQPGNVPVYRPRRMADGDRGGGMLPLGHGRLTPSFRWIGAAFRLSEEDVLRRHGLDALVVIRLFKFGLWVHFSCLCFISFYVVYLLLKEYKEITRRRIEHLKHHSKRPDQYTILVRGIPTCPDHGTYGCYVDHFFSKHYETYQSYQIVHDIGNIEALQDSRLPAEFEVTDGCHPYDSDKDNVLAVQVRWSDGSVS